MSRLPFTISNQSLTFYVKGRPFSLVRDNPNYAEVRRLLQAEGDHDAQHLVDLTDLTDVRQAILRTSFGKIVMDGADIIWQGQVLQNLWVDKILDFRQAGEDFNPIWNALDRLMHNPTPQAIERLPIFLERSKLGFLPDGRFIAFKGVDADLRSGRANLDGTYFTHEIGAKPRMPREAVDANPNQTCSHGLHVGAPGYVRSHYSGASHALVLVAVDPVDVVAVPTDYDGEKMRVCGYEVIDHLEQSYSDELLGRLKNTVRGYDPKPAPVVEPEPEENDQSWVDLYQIGDVVQLNSENYAVVIAIKDDYISARDSEGDVSDFSENDISLPIVAADWTGSIFACVGADVRIEGDPLIRDGEYRITGYSQDGDNQDDETDSYFLIGDQNVAVQNGSIKTVTYDGVQLYPVTTVTTEEFAVDHTWAPVRPVVGDMVALADRLGTYEVLDTSPTGVIVQTQHDGKVFVNEALVTIATCRVAS